MLVVNKFNTDNINVIDNTYLQLSNTYISSCRFKKITGSRLASILNLNKYTSEFVIWLIMVKMYDEKMDETLAMVGNIIEPKIRDFVCQKTKIEFKSYDPRTINYDCFSDNKIFGGIPDGEPIEGYISDNPMLEIKTTSIDKLKYKFDINGGMIMEKDNNNCPIAVEPNGKRNEWFDKNNNLIIPLNYQLQIGLYMHLCNVKNGLFAIGFLSPIDYANPQAFDCQKKYNENNLVLHHFKINEIKNLDKYIDDAKKWYENHILTGKSPNMSYADKKWLKERIDQLK